MCRRYLSILSLLLIMAPSVRADEILVLSANNFRQFVTAATPSFEQASGHRLTISFASTKGVMDAVRDGKSFDVVLVEDASIADLERRGVLAAGSRRALAIAEMVLMTRPEDKVSANTVEELRAALQNAKSLAYPDPSGGGLSGALFARILRETSLADTVTNKTKLGKNTADVVRMIEQSEAEIGASQRSETRTNVLVFAPLPSGLGADVVLSGAISARANGSQPAKALLEFLWSSAAVEFITASRLKPPH